MRLGWGRCRGGSRVGLERSAPPQLSPQVRDSSELQGGPLLNLACVFAPKLGIFFLKVFFLIGCLRF